MGGLKEAVDDVLANRDLPFQEAVDRHYHPSFRQRVNGQWDDRASVVDRLRSLRESIARVEVTVLDELSIERQYAERHIIELFTIDGRHIELEVYLFAERHTDGRFIWIDEVSRPLERNSS